MDKQNKPPTSDSEGGAPPALPAARSPYRPLSRRRRQERLAEPESPVERSAASPVFDASPTRIAAALVRAGAAPDESTLTWGRANGPAGGDAEVAGDAEMAGDAEVAGDAEMAGDAEGSGDAEVAGTD